MAVPVFLGVCFVIFFLVRLLPGDIATYYAAQSERGLNLERVRAAYGLDRPIMEQYVTWQSSVLRGDLGQSMYTRQPVMQRTLDRLPMSAELALLAILLQLVVAIPVGVLSALRRDSVVDHLGRILATFGLS